MPAVKIDLKTSYGSTATLEGFLEPAGGSGYKFLGTISAQCKLDRSATYFNNIVRMGHGGASGRWVFEEFQLVGAGTAETIQKLKRLGSLRRMKDFQALDYLEQKELEELEELEAMMAQSDTSGSAVDLKGNNAYQYAVNINGVRSINDKVDFCLGFNEGLSGEFSDGGTVTFDVGGPFQKILSNYTVEDDNRNLKYWVQFDGQARADGPTGYVLEGVFNAYAADGYLTQQYAKIGYGSSSGSWIYKVYPCDDIPKDIKIFGVRKAGEKIQVVLGATSKPMNLYGFGETINCELPDIF